MSRPSHLTLLGLGCVLLLGLGCAEARARPGDEAAVAVAQASVASEGEGQAPASNEAPARRVLSSHPGVVIRPRASIIAHEPGRVASVEVGLGQAVEAGQVLVTLDTSALRQELAQARARYHEVHATLDAAQLRASHRAAELDADRGVSEILSARELRTSERAAADAKAAVLVARAQLEAAAAELDSLERRIDAASLRAPIAGRVSGQLPELGARAEADAPVLELVGRGPARVRFAVDAGLAGAELGARVELGLEHGGRRWPARVSHRAPGVDPVAQLLIVEAELIEDAPELLAGQACIVELGQP